MPEKVRDAPIVASIDYDGNGDQGIYVTNGTGMANPFNSNRFVEAAHGPVWM